jgi:hypothetical protein
LTSARDIVRTQTSRLSRNPKKKRAQEVGVVSRCEQDIEHPKSSEGGGQM